MISERSTRARPTSDEKTEHEEEAAAQDPAAAASGRGQIMEQKILPHEHSRELEEHLERIPDSEDFDVVAALYRQLADPTRIRVFWILCHAEECVINLASMTDMSSPALIHHLKQLRDAGLISCRKEGREVYYKAADTETVKALHEMIEMLVRISCPDQLEKSTRPVDRIELIRKIREYAASDLTQRHTVEELSRRFLINTASLKETFREVYGQPIGSYMKELRMKKAAELLADPAISIAEIASLVGYGNRSKFAAAFREYSGMQPTEYRDRCGGGQDAAPQPADAGD